MRSLLIAVSAIWMLVAPLAGQVTPASRPHEIRGTVFDSIAGVPLGGAVVQVAARDSAGVPHTVITDARGRFVVPNLPSGTFVVGFYHENLSALGLDAPVVAVALGADSVAIVSLWIPSAPVVRALRCGGGIDADAGGMLAGFVRDAETGLAVSGAALRLSWRALALDSANYRTVTERATAEIAADGSYLVCKLPVDATLDLDVTAPGRRTLAGGVATIATSGVTRLDIALIDTARTTGTSSIRGHVTRASGKVVATGQAVIAALGREAPIRDGAFVMNDVPPGSWIVEARVMGSEPQTMLVAASAGSTVVAELRIGESLQRLEAVTVVGQRDANSLVLEEVLRRKRIGMGTVFLPGSPALKSATFTSDVMREARGFLYQGRDRIFARVIRTGRRCQSIAVYVDNLLQPDGIAGINSVAPSEVLAIETFSDILLAPVQYRIMKPMLEPSNDKYCAVVLVWTRDRPNR